MGWLEYSVNRWGETGYPFASTAEVNAGFTDEKYLCPKNVDSIVALASVGFSSGGTILGNLPHITLGNTTSYATNSTTGFDIEFNTHPQNNPWYFTHYTDYENHKIKVLKEGMYKITGLITFEIDPADSSGFTVELKYFVNGTARFHMNSIQGCTYDTDPLLMVADLDATLVLNANDVVHIEGYRNSTYATGQSVAANQTNITLCMMNNYTDDEILHGH